jgi:hypothetical protein
MSRRLELDETATAAGALIHGERIMTTVNSVGDMCDAAPTDGAGRYVRARHIADAAAEIRLRLPEPADEGDGVLDQYDLGRDLCLSRGTSAEHDVLAQGPPVSTTLVSAPIED